MTLARFNQGNELHRKMAGAVRSLALDAVAAAGSGHSGMPIGFADVATVLFTRHMRFDIDAPDWPDRDRFVLSAGHGSMLLYALLYLMGDRQVTRQQVQNFRQLGSLTAGHPENTLINAVETTTGPLGQGIGNAVGLAVAEEALRSCFGRKVVDHCTYVVAGDGCLMEGVSQEAITLAGHLGLSRLVLLWDDNRITIDGPLDLADSTDQIRRFGAAGWHTQAIDGHDPVAVDNALAEARGVDRPSMIACRSEIAIGHVAQGTARGHGALLDPAENTAAKNGYGVPEQAFAVAPEVKTAWEQAGRRGVSERVEWQKRLDALSGRQRGEFLRRQRGDPPARLRAALSTIKRSAVSSGTGAATRKSSEKVLACVNPLLPEIIGGSADLTGSNNTFTRDLGVFNRANRKGRYIHFGIREHAMGAAMNGMALHGGVRAYGGTFLAFSDYARPALRLSALMGLPVTWVMTHDSIGLGEDGPTHQPVEHLAACRAIPNLVVLRPADMVETVEAWEIALAATRSPTMLALTRQTLPAVRKQHSRRNLVASGAYVLAEARAKRQVILIASGSEVAVALSAREMLEAESVGTRVVSMPSMELFSAADPAYRRRVLPAGPVRLGIEAAVSQGWDRWLCSERGRESKAGFVGMSGFGASAPSASLFQHFGITAEKTVEEVHRLLQ